jgi:uncharacterized protein YndB with AHSA1/START domain
MTNATLLTEGALPAVRLERELADPPEVVWRAITERDQLRSWFPCDVIVDGGEWVPGAAIRFPFPREVIDLTLAGEVLEVSEPNRLAYTWGDEVLRFELCAAGAGTRLVLINELPGSRAARNATGWEDCLDRLVDDGAKQDAWQPRFDAYAAEFEPLIGKQDGPPAGIKP